MHIEELAEKRDEEFEIELAETPTRKLKEVRDAAQEIVDRAEREIEFRGEDVLEFDEFSIELKESLDNGLTTGTLKFDGGSKEVYVEDFVWGLKCVAQGASDKICAGLLYNRDGETIHISAGDGGFSVSVSEAGDIMQKVYREV